MNHVVILGGFLAFTVHGFCRYEALLLIIARIAEHYVPYTYSYTLLVPPQHAHDLFLNVNLSARHGLTLNRLRSACLTPMTDACLKRKNAYLSYFVQAIGLVPRDLCEPTFWFEHVSYWVCSCARERVQPQDQRHAIRAKQVLKELARNRE
jgi:hypothetical protein